MRLDQIAAHNEVVSCLKMNGTYRDSWKNQIYGALLLAKEDAGVELDNKKTRELAEALAERFLSKLTL